MMTAKIPVSKQIIEDTIGGNRKYIATAIGRNNIITSYSGSEQISAEYVGTYER